MTSRPLRYYAGVLEFLSVWLVGLLLSWAVQGAALAREKKPTADELLASADARIEKCRKADVAIVVTDRDGRSVPGASVRVVQLRHAFLFGCNIFPLFTYKGEQHETYGREFAALFNYATLPFYWGGYEPKPGEKHVAANERLARWCRDHGIVTKGHPLVWHIVYPSWAPSDPDETRAKLEARVTDVVGHFKGLIDRWDVVNEVMSSANYDNGVGHWVKRDGTAAVVGQALEWAHAANPQAVLLYNDFDAGPQVEKLVGNLQQNHKPLGAIGFQSHMHTAEWPLERAWQVCETYARFGVPLDFTELTVLSGHYKTDNDWFKFHPDWPTTPEGETRQADYVPKFYTLLFSHPAVEAITWWDFMDGGWQGAPAGLVRADLTPKPAYERLRELIKGKWWTTCELKTDARGRGQVRGFLGQYRVTVVTPDGEVSREFELKRDSKEWSFRLDH